jgi:hypothetical protein
MQMLTRQSPPDIWIDQMFSTKAARRGAVVRRSLAWVDREVGRDRFIMEIRRRGYHLIRTADQFIVICHSGPINILF